MTINTSQELLHALSNNVALTADSRGRISERGALGRLFDRICDFFSRSSALGRAQRLGAAIDRLLSTEREVVNPARDPVDGTGLTQERRDHENSVRRAFLVRYMAGFDPAQVGAISRMTLKQAQSLKHAQELAQGFPPEQRNAARNHIYALEEMFPEATDGQLVWLARQYDLAPFKPIPEDGKQAVIDVFKGQLEANHANVWNASPSSKASQYVGDCVVRGTVRGERLQSVTVSVDGKPAFTPPTLAEFHATIPGDNAAIKDFLAGLCNKAT
ncbi:MAG: hypothetical protein HUK26_07535, partial [Duodenibacillus sp.]|nr:hypothetical protein [Duodenibacillus sp.]